MHWSREMHRLCAARPGPRDPGAETPFDTTQPGDLLARPAGAAPRPVSILCHGRWSAVRPRPPRAASTPLPKSSARERPLSAAASEGTNSRSSLCHVCAVRGGTEQDGASDGFGERFGLSALDEGEHASTETGAHDACAVAARGDPRLL